MPAEGHIRLVDRQPHEAHVCGHRVMLQREVDSVTGGERIWATEEVFNENGTINLDRRRIVKTVSFTEKEAVRTPSGERALWVVQHEDVRKAFGWSDPNVLYSIAAPVTLGGMVTQGMRPGEVEGMASCTIKVVRDSDGVRALCDIIGTNSVHMSDVLLATRPSSATEVVIMREHIEAAVVALGRTWTVPNEPTSYAIYNQPRGLSYGGGWGSVPHIVSEPDESDAWVRLRPDTRGRKPKTREPAPPPAVRPVGRLYDLDD